MKAAIATHPVIGPGIRRDPATWYCYLLLGFFTYLLNIQGNIIPFLQSELGLGYRAVSLHSAFVATGMIAVGLFGDRVARRCDRRRTLLLGAGGASAGAMLLCLAPTAWASIGSCALIGAFGGLIPGLVPTILADIHGDRRDVAYAEAGAMSYAFAVLAPLAVSLCIWLALGWRAAMLLAVAAGGLIVLRFRDVPFREPATPDGHRARLPMRYWAYWCLLTIVISMEFCVLLWAPAFLERVVGMPQATAALAAAAFAVAMLIGRTAMSGLVRIVAPRTLFLAALLVTCLGFTLYWGFDLPSATVAGLFVLGLGVAPLYPLTIGFAIGVAGAQGDSASARFMLAVGVAVITAPVLLGAVADEVGLRSAQLVLPALLATALGAFGVASIMSPARQDAGTTSPGRALLRDTEQSRAE